jgi:hypothetical protein
MSDPLDLKPRRNHTLGIVLAVVACGFSFWRLANKIDGCKPSGEAQDIRASQQAAVAQLEAKNRAIKELAELDGRGYAGVTADQLLQKFRQRYPSSRVGVADSCALWALLQLIKTKKLTDPVMVEGTVRLARRQIAALKPPLLDTTEGTAMGLGFVETAAYADLDKFNCENTDADFGLLSGEASRTLASARGGLYGGFDPERGQAPAHVRGPVYLYTVLRAKLDRLLEEDLSALNRKLYAEIPVDPLMLQCEVRYLKQKTREEPWAQTVDEGEDPEWTEYIPRFAAIAATQRKLQAPVSLPQEKRAYITLDGYKPSDCHDTIRKAVQAAEQGQDSAHGLYGVSFLVGVGTDTHLGLLVLRSSDIGPGFSTPFVLGMAVGFAGRVKVVYHGFDPTDFGKARFRATVNGSETITWPWEDPLAEDTPDKPRKKSARIKVQGVEVTCTPAGCDPNRHTAIDPVPN